jgi:excisionase family DNA binding protein
VIFIPKFAKEATTHPSDATDIHRSSEVTDYRPDDLERPVDVKTAAQFLGVSPSLVYAYVERKQIPHYRMMGRAIRFKLSELAKWRQQFHVNGGITESKR